MIQTFFLLVSVLLIVFAVYLLLGTRRGAPFVPTGRKTIQRMLTLGEVGPGDVCLDLGSGTGRIVFACARAGAVARGVEINPFLVAWAKARAALGGYRNAAFVCGDLWQTDLSQVDVLTIFFIKEKMPELYEKVRREMRPGARIVSHVFTFPGWPYEKKDGTVYVYRI